MVGKEKNLETDSANEPCLIPNPELTWGLRTQIHEKLPALSRKQFLKIFRRKDYYKSNMLIHFNRIFFGLILAIHCGRGIAQDETDETATYLFSQTAQNCKLLKKESGSGSKVGQFQLKSKDFNPSTIIFSNRPVQTAATMDTVVAVSNLADFFNPTTGGPPNVVVNLANQDCKEGAGEPATSFVAYIAKAGVQDDGGIVYRLDQTEEQKRVLDLESYFDDVDSDKLEFDMCSIFIDDVAPSFGCKPKGYPCDWVTECCTEGDLTCCNADCVCSGGSDCYTGPGCNTRRLDFV